MAASMSAAWRRATLTLTTRVMGLRLVGQVAEQNVFQRRGSSQYPHLPVQGGARPGDEQAQSPRTAPPPRRMRQCRRRSRVAILATSAVNSRPGNGTWEASEVESINAMSSEVSGCTTARSACGRTTEVMTAWAACPS
jgi:hypothetical protein